MYSKEFMNFLFNYQKDDFKPKENTQVEINFKNNGRGKLIKIYLPVDK